MPDEQRWQRGHLHGGEEGGDHVEDVGEFRLCDGDGGGDGDVEERLEQPSRARARGRDEAVVD